MRLRATRWPEPATALDWTQGVPVGYVQDLCRYWAEEYDWPAREERLNQVEQFVIEIDGMAIHFLHVPSSAPNALPLVLTHGWPGSFVEFMDVIGPLSETYHVVVPSLPGYGWSGKPSEGGWGVARIADAWAELMTRLGYDRFGAQGGDWGAAVTVQLAACHPDRVVGIHLNMVSVGPPRGQEHFSEREQKALVTLQQFRRHGSGYAEIQRTRPQTLGYGLADSPAGQCAWILEKFQEWSDCDGDPVAAFGPDRLLDNIAVYWFGNSAASSARLYWESYGKPSPDVITVPTGASLFPKDLVQPPREWAAERFRDLRMWHELDRGGHFAAFEQPELFVAEVREFFGGLK